MNIILTLITGLCISAMIFFNGSLEGIIGNIPAIIFIHVVGLILTSPLFIKKTEKKSMEKKSRWYLLAGVLGIAVVTISNKVFWKGGVLLTLSGTLAGQVIMAAVMEWVKHKKEKKSMPIGKILSLALVLPGSIIIGLRSGLTFDWILLSWIPGAIILMQSFMNSQNILSIGFRKTLVFHFGTALAVLLPMMLFIPMEDAFSKVFSGQVPILFLIGGGSLSLFVITIGSYLLLKIKPITYVLLMYCGQLTGAMMIDSLSGYGFSIEKAAAMGLVIAGLFLGELKKKKRIIS